IFMYLSYHILSLVSTGSKKGHPYDIAVAEAFFKFLKLEETNRRSYTSLDELELSVFEYIHFYNFKRPHSANDLLSPVQFEELF
ncbi:IS3 family transposase, partial [Ruminococcus sp.]|uniref:IS3 family transposase n=2 Tax=Ruminococcus sp. TaxID=41978 RepID=UPI003079AFF0